MSEILEIEIMTGKICIDLELCKTCPTKACVAACAAGIFKADGDVIALNKPAESVKKGLCTETMACQLECSLKGKGALKIVLSMPEYDAYIRKTREGNTRLVHFTEE